MEKKVSIILPIYNQENNLDVSIPSVLNQTWKNIEIIAVNDGSTDGSLDIINRYVALDDRIVIINKDNGGLVDAVIYGIKKATGEYICFLDPDDVIGLNFVETFMNNINDYDFIAMGYFENNGKVILEHTLKNDKIYSYNDIQVLKQTFLYKDGNKGINNEIFISRWNKLYKVEIVKNILPLLETIKNVSLGEDTIFTYLMLQESNSCIALSRPNTYVYNTNSSTSMMKNGEAKLIMQKAKKAYYQFARILNIYNQKEEQAVALYYFLCSTLLDRINSNLQMDFSDIYNQIKNDKLFKKSLKLFQKNIGNRLKIMCFVPKYNQYQFVIELINNLKKLDLYIRTKKNKIKTFFKCISNNKITKGIITYKYQKRRIDAFKDLEEQLPTLEQQITPILNKWKNKTTDFDKCPIEKNIFVFWWDGFEKSPKIVKKCIESIYKFHQDYNIIVIDKFNFQNYSNINSAILKAFEENKISIQTFSDILRFNLLKNNGGIWIDATIFFTRPFNLIEGLEKNSINTVEFNSSKQFLEYKGCYCSWSGFYFASRKNAVLVNAMNDIFELYYMKYKTYPIYFFIDAALMICKINNIDDDALSKSKKVWADMFFLENNKNSIYSSGGEYIIGLVPQKLSWFARNDNMRDSYFERIVNKNDNW